MNNRFFIILLVLLYIFDFFVLANIMLTSYIIDKILLFILDK